MIRNQPVIHPPLSSSIVLMSTGSWTLLIRLKPSTNSSIARRQKNKSANFSTGISDAEGTTYVGGWGVPTCLPARDVNVDGFDSNQPFDEVSLRKVMGYHSYMLTRVDEDGGKQLPEQRGSQADYIKSVSGCTIS